jgi:hypothetical protein
MAVEITPVNGSPTVVQIENEVQRGRPRMVCGISSSPFQLLQSWLQLSAADFKVREVSRQQSSCHIRRPHPQKAKRKAARTDEKLRERLRETLRQLEAKLGSGEQAHFQILANANGQMVLVNAKCN